MNIALANPLAGLSTDFGLKPPAKNSNKSSLPSCEDVPELAPGVEDQYCFGKYTFEYAESEVFGQILFERIKDATSESEIRYLVLKNPILRAGAALIALCREGIFDPDHISCNIEYKF